MILFNKPPFTGNEDQYVLEAMRSPQMAGDGPFSKKCQEWFEQNLNCVKSFLTPNCTQALEMAAILLNIMPGDEVIMPSYTFVSTANAFVLRGAKIVFVDIRPDTMNINEHLIEQAITKKSKAVVVVHYAGVGCEMDKIMEVASKYDLYVIEDAAQGMMAEYKGRPLGTIGDIGTFSFHETKNFTSGGEGGLLLLNDQSFVERAEIIREKGTNRKQFFRGEVDKYSWVDLGSSYLPSDLQAAYLWGQLEKAQEINNDRLQSWRYYYENLQAVASLRHIELATVPESCFHNAHMFYVKVLDLYTRTALLDYLRLNKILSVFHYVPLHSSKYGKISGEFSGMDVYTTTESERLIRLPLWYGISNRDQDAVIKAVTDFFS